MQTVGILWPLCSVRVVSVLLMLLTTGPGVNAQDLVLYGKFNLYLNPMNSKEVGFITSKCFNGLGLSTCSPNLSPNVFDRNKNLPYYNKLEPGQLYCASCCGTNTENKDYWDMHCTMDTVSAVTTNVYGYDLRLSARNYEGDKTIVTCPLPRSACQYDGKTTLNCDGQQTDSTFLHGYTATINVKMMDQNFVYWRAITDCSITAMESPVPLQLGDTFYEKFIIVHTPNMANSLPDAPKILSVLLLFYFLAYAVLFYFRRKHCSYCQGKLVFSKELCFKCWFVGAQPVDPFLLAVLEEKGEIMQGEMPERFPGSREFVRRVEHGYAMLMPSCFSCVERCSQGVRVAPASAPNPDDETAAAAAAAAAPAPATGPLGSMLKMIKPPKWFKRWRKRRLERLAANKINPNLLPFPKHIIYGAVGHPNVPEMDPESAAKRKQILIESLGFDPEAFEDDDEEGAENGENGEGGGDGEGESKSGSPIGAAIKSKKIPDWQKKQFQKRSSGSAGAEVPSFFRRLQMRGAYVKRRNYIFCGPIRWRFVLPFVLALVCTIIVLAVGAAIVTGAVSFSNPTATPSVPNGSVGQ